MKIVWAARKTEKAKKETKRRIERVIIACALPSRWLMGHTVPRQ